jgi:hypothetical protein
MGKTFNLVGRSERGTAMRKLNAVLGCLCVFAVLATPLYAADPVVSNVRASQRAESKLVDIWYNVADDDGDRQTVSVAVTVDGSPLATSSFSGHVGPNVTPGNNRHIVWDADADWSGQFSSAVRFTITANDGGNLVNNGEFSQGNIGFSTEFQYFANTSILNENAYAIVTNPRSVHYAWGSFGDHTSGSGNMMAMNGAATSPLVVWSQSVSVRQNKSYRFSMWVASSYSANPALLRVSINDSPIILEFAALSSVGVWKEGTAEWNSGPNSTATIKITDIRLEFGGNDYALDDISFILSE